LKDIEHDLRRDVLYAIVAYLTSYTFQRWPPGIGILRSQFGLRFM